MVSSTPRPHFTPGKDPVPIVQEVGWGPGPVWTGGKSRPHRDSIPDRPARSQSLYRLSYPAHVLCIYVSIIFMIPVPVAARSKAARLLRLWVRIPPGAWMSVSCECCVLSDTGLYDALITRPEESYGL